MTREHFSGRATEFSKVARAQTLAALSNFHVVQVYDYFDEGGRCYLVEEYVRGQTLQQRIASRGRLSVDEIVTIALQVLDALEYLHGLAPPLVHRDLKPDNVMLAPATGGAEMVKLIDFGIARHFQPQRGTVHGTPGYAAPEQYRGLSEPRTDLYALGGILHYALSGRDPQEQAPFSFPPLQSLRPDLPATLCALVDQALNNDVDRRPASAAEFRTRLQAIAQPHPAPVLKPPAPAPPHPSNAPTVVLPEPQPHPIPAPQPHIPAPSKIEWSPAEVMFDAVQRGGQVEPVTLTVRNIGRGTLEAHVDTDRPDLVRVTPDHIGENQAHLTVRIDSAAVMWGHRYRANVRLVMDHSGGTVAIPVVIQAADHEAILARMHALSTSVMAAALTIALGGEIVLAGAGLTVSGSLHGAALATLRQAADIFSVVGLLAVVILIAAAQRRGRWLRLILGLIAINAFHATVAALFIDYLMIPALVLGLAKGGAIALRRLCIRMLARQGLGLMARLRAWLLLMAPPMAAMLAAGAWMITAARPAPSLSTTPWPPPTPYAPPTAASNPNSPTVTKRAPTRYRVTARPRRTPRAPELIESDVRQRLAASGFGDIGVSVDSLGRAYISGSAADFEQKRQIETVVRGVAGVRSLTSSLEVPKGWLGVTVKPGPGGATVTYVAPNGPAERAGIAVNDVIVAIDGDPVRDYADFHRAIETKALGQTITVAVRRGAQTINVAVRLTKKTFRPG